MARTYQWKPTDNLFNLATLYQTTPQEILSANKGGTPFSVGQTINIPGPGGKPTGNPKGQSFASWVAPVPNPIVKTPATVTKPFQYTPSIGKPVGNPYGQTLSQWAATSEVATRAAGIPVAKPVVSPIFPANMPREEQRRQGLQNIGSTTTKKGDSYSNDPMFLVGSLQLAFTTGPKGDARWLPPKVTPEIMAYGAQNGMDLLKYYNPDGTLKTEIAQAVTQGGGTQPTQNGNYTTTQYGDVWNPYGEKVTDLGNNGVRVGNFFGKKGDKWTVSYENGMKVTRSAVRGKTHRITGRPLPRSNNQQSVQPAQPMTGFGLVNFEASNQ